MGHFSSEWDYGAWPLAFPITVLQTLSVVQVREGPLIKGKITIEYEENIRDFKKLSVMSECPSISSVR